MGKECCQSIMLSTTPLNLNNKEQIKGLFYIIKIKIVLFNLIFLYCLFIGGVIYEIINAPLEMPQVLDICKNQLIILYFNMKE